MDCVSGPTDRRGARRQWDDQSLARGKRQVFQTRSRRHEAFGSVGGRRDSICKSRRRRGSLVGNHIERDAMQWRALGFTWLVTPLLLGPCAVAGPTRAGSEWRCMPDDMQKELDKKKAKYPKYRARCDRAWLLMVAANDKRSSFIELPAETLGHHFDSPFDRVFFMDALRHKHHELKKGPAI